MSDQSIIDDHYLRLSIHHNHLHADIECIHHEQCEAAQRVAQDKAEHQNDQGVEYYDIILEWFADSDAKVLRSGNISLFEDTHNGFNFASWRYVNDEHPHPEQVIDELRSTPLANHSLIGWVKSKTGPCFDIICTTRHAGAYWNEDEEAESSDEHDDVLCLGGQLTEWVNGVDNLFNLYGGLENSEFRDDYINIVAEYTTDYWGESDGDVAWTYLTDMVGESV